MSGESSDRVPDVVGLLLPDAEALLSGRRWKPVLTAPPSRKGEDGPDFPAPLHAQRVLRQWIDEDGTVVLTMAVESAPDAEGR